MVGWVLLVLLICVFVVMSVWFDDWGLVYVFFVWFLGFRLFDYVVLGWVFIWLLWVVCKFGHLFCLLVG